MANKRKRDDLDDSDSDEITPGKQILPVANLPRDFDQEPQDGMQYLFLVRRDARRLPHITRVKNPYEVPETKVTYTPATPSAVLPREEWRITFQTHFSNLRRNLTQATNEPQGPKPKVIPEKKNRDAWWAYLAGYPESAWRTKDKSVRKKLGMSYRARAFAGPTEAACIGYVSDVSDVQPRDVLSHLPTACLCDNFQQQLDSPDVVLESPYTVDLLEEAEEIGKLLPPMVTPSHLKGIDHRMSIHLLMYFTHWMNIHLQNPSDPMTAISVGHGQWVFALLTKIEDELSADEMSLLRNLARACLGLIQGKNVTSEGESGHVRMSEASCWMIFAAIAGYWGQRDLWGDAETALAVGNDL